MNYTATEIYNAVQFGGTFFSEHQKEQLVLAIQRADSDPMEIVSVGRLFIAMAKSEIERERAQWALFSKEPQYDLTEKGIDEVDALRCGGVL